MKKKVIGVILLILMVSTMVLVSKVDAAGSATGTITAVKSGTASVSNWVLGPDPDPNGTQIAVDLYVSGASNVWSWFTDISWNASLLELTSIQEGLFLKKNPSGGTLFMGTNPETWKTSDAGFGYIMGGLSSTRMSSSKTNNVEGVMATLIFTVIGSGQADIILSDGVLTDVDQETSSADVHSASVTLRDSSYTSPAKVDVFTQNGGSGLNEHSDPFGPGALIDAQALVTYNNASVANVDVSFNVMYQNGTAFATKTSASNSNGYASAQFRLPWLDNDYPESTFGNWTISASASVSQDVAIDVVTFSYNYLVNIDSVQVPDTVQKLSTLPIEITTDNIASSQTMSTVVITIFDETQTPIACEIAHNSDISTGDTLISSSVSIPASASVGQATVHIVVLTDTPDDSGTPYCPEEVVSFQITS